MRYIMGVDGGGSKTYAVIVDETGRKVGSGVSGCGNHQMPGIKVALGNIKEATETALSEAKLTKEQMDYVEFGLAGADREKDFSILRPAIASLGYKNYEIVCDTMEGLRTGSAENVGVVLVCGSGTNAAGRNRNGETVQTGGFGYLFGDQAGGNEMALQTFRSAIRSWEHRDIPSILPEKVAKHLGFRDIEEVVNHYLDHDIYKLKDGSLTVVLHEAAKEGDALAIRILKQTGHELGMAAYSVIVRLGGFEDTGIPIVLVGSVIQKGRSEYILNSIKDTLQEKGYQAALIIPEMAPVYGAIMIGMDHLQIPVTETIHQLFISYGGYNQ